MLLRMIEANTRQPVHVLGDLRAQLAACRVGERGLIGLIERYGADAHELHGRAAAPRRAA